MFSALLLELFLFAAAVNAHFVLTYPSPRGTFDEDNEGKFCDGINSVNNSRVQFPLNNGFFNVESHHQQWSVGVLLSNSSSPASFKDFQQIGTFQKSSGEGTFCVPINLQSTNATNMGIKDGSNVTMQILFDGGDGALYMCADMTLSSSFQISGVNCSNSIGSALASSPSASGTAPGGSSSSSSPSGAVHLNTLPIMFTAAATSVTVLAGALMLAL